MAFPTYISLVILSSCLLYTSGQDISVTTFTPGRPGQCPQDTSVYTGIPGSCTTDSSCTASLTQKCCITPNTQDEGQCIDPINVGGSGSCLYFGVTYSNMQTWLSSEHTGQATCTCVNSVVQCLKPGNCATDFVEPSSGQCALCTVGRDDECNSTSKCCPGQNSCAGASSCFRSTAVQCPTNHNELPFITGNRQGRSEYFGLPEACQTCTCDGVSGVLRRSGGCTEECIPSVCYAPVAGRIERIFSTAPGRLCNATASFRCACINGRLTCRVEASEEPCSAATRMVAYLPMLVSVLLASYMLRAIL